MSPCGRVPFLLLEGYLMCVCVCVCVRLRVRARACARAQHTHHTHSPQALEERVGGILMRIERELDDAEKTIGERLHVIDLDNDGLISPEELEEVIRGAIWGLGLVG